MHRQNSYNRQYSNPDNIYHRSESNSRSNFTYSERPHYQDHPQNKDSPGTNIVIGKRDFLEFSNSIDNQRDGDEEYSRTREGKKQVRTEANEIDWSPESKRSFSHPPIFLSPDEERLAPWMTNSTQKIKNTLVRFHNEIIDFVNFITPSKEDHNKREKGLEKLKEAILEVIPNAKIIPFGSFATCLYLPHGDIDLVVVEPSIHPQTMMNKLAKALMKNPDYESVNVIRSAKVPLIKLIERNTNYNFDLSFNKLDGVNQLREIQKGLEYYPEMKHLLLVLKCFLKQRDLNETYSGGIGSFLLFSLVLTYLREIRREYIKNDMEDEIAKLLLSEHLLKFFEFYANFDIVGKQIIVAEGGAIVDKYEKDTSFSVISPQDASHDIGGSSFKAKEIFGIWKNRYHFLTNYNFGERESILKYLFKAEYL